MALCLAIVVAFVLVALLSAAGDGPLPGTKPLTMDGDFAAEMVAGIDRFLMRELEASPQRRARHWRRDPSSRKAYAQAVAPNRERFRKYVGLVDERAAADLRALAALPASGTPKGALGEAPGYTVHAVQWSVLRGVDGEGLLLQPKRTPVADVVALPDCDDKPEMLVGLAKGVPREAQFARRLAENGCRVIVPTLVDRDNTYSGIPELGRKSAQPHREFIYRAAFELGRTMIGYEVQRVLAAVEWLEQSQGPRKRKVGVMGYGEGGLVAFYAAAAYAGIDAACVSGYFRSRQRVWEEPIYRNVFGLLDEFGDAEIASLIAPRALVVESCPHPHVCVPDNEEGSGPTPGKVTTPPPEEVEREFARARELAKGLRPAQSMALVQGAAPGGDAALAALLKRLAPKQRLAPSGRAPRRGAPSVDAQARHKRQYEQLLGHTQYLLREAEFRRAELWDKADDASVEGWTKSCRWYRDYLWDEVIGRLPPASLPARPRTRLVYDEPGFRGYEVLLDVWPDVFAYGILLVPKRMRRGERRPLVVCQHGLEGTCQVVTDPHSDSAAYRSFGARLAERGFVVYAPQNPYKGFDRFRVLQRKLNPLKKSLFSVIVRQHEVSLAWLGSLPFVDPKRMALYGISYGGKTAMRVPALLEQYALSICSADFDEWIWKNASARHRYSYLLSGEYEMPEFDLGNTFNYAELSWLIFPRPFMVERGHHDGVAPDEWVAYEYARTRRLYALLGHGERTEIEFFDGPHTIHGAGTFAFLHKHLRWPLPR